VQPPALACEGVPTVESTEHASLKQPTSACMHPTTVLERASPAPPCLGEATLEEMAQGASHLALAGARRTPRVEGACDRRADELRAYPACTGLLR
jgi:hypothetical protein